MKVQLVEITVHPLEKGTYGVGFEGVPDPLIKVETLSGRQLGNFFTIEAGDNRHRFLDPIGLTDDHIDQLLVVAELVLRGKTSAIDHRHLTALESEFDDPGTLLSREREAVPDDLWCTVRVARLYLVKSDSITISSSSTRTVHPGLFSPKGNSMMSPS
jgi:hypothetical protein